MRQYKLCSTVFSDHGSAGLEKKVLGSVNSVLPNICIKFYSMSN